MMELGGARHHYHAPLTRTIYLGSPPGEIVALAATIVEGVDAALDRARPGATCEEVEAAWQHVLNRNGYKKESRVGYSIGLNYSEKRNGVACFGRHKKRSASRVPGPLG